MFVIRDVMHCKPGKVGELVKKFKGLNPVMVRLGYKPARILTDVSGEQFWTAVFELEAPTLDGFRDMEAAVMSDKEAQSVFSGYHELVLRGRREIFKLEG